MPVTLHIVSMPSLEYLIFRNNFVRVLKQVTVSQNTSVKIDLSRNNMVSFAGSFDFIIQNYGFRLIGLCLSENRLGEELDKKGDQVFKYLTDLKRLDLSDNVLKNLPQLIFRNQFSLEYLILSKNSLMLLTFNISHLKNLLFLDLSENLLSQFGIAFQSEMESLKYHSPNFTIDMLGNPFQCSCGTIQSLTWMHHRQSMFYRYDKYTCIYNSKLFTFNNMSRMLDLLNTECSQDLILKISASLLALFIVVIALSVFLYRHKWDVKFFCLRFITNRKAYQELQETDTEYEYDAFVSYHKDDRGWVRNDLYENIDMRKGEVDMTDQSRFRLCIHDRDFIPGEAIEENILKAIESSRKTIVVLSKNFLKSPWCEFELQIARKECVEKGRNLIIAVMLEPLSVEDKMSRSVEWLIRKNTYIEWPEDPLERNHFWEKLRAALEP